MERISSPNLGLCFLNTSGLSQHEINRINQILNISLPLSQSSSCPYTPQSAALGERPTNQGQQQEAAPPATGANKINQETKQPAPQGHAIQFGSVNKRDGSQQSTNLPLTDNDPAHAASNGIASPPNPKPTDATASPANTKKTDISGARYVCPPPQPPTPAPTSPTANGTAEAGSPVSEPAVAAVTAAVAEPDVNGEAGEGELGFPALSNGAPASTPTTVTESPGGAGEGKMSWASLFKGSASEEQARVIPLVETVTERESSPEEKTAIVAAKDDVLCMKLGEFLHNYKVNNMAVCLQPKGMINRSNNCYINATLQAMASVSQFYHLFNDFTMILRKDCRTSTSTPMCDILWKVMSQFSKKERANNIRRSKNQQLSLGEPFEPHLIDEARELVLRGQRGMALPNFMSGHQEDAHEFLSALLNFCHDEMRASIEHATGQKTPALTNGLPEAGADNHVAEEENDDEEWQEVGRKHKRTHVQRPLRQKTPITDICGGVLSNNIQQTGGAGKQTILENFFDLQLNIQGEQIESVHDAMEFFTRREIIEGSKDPSTGKPAELVKRMLFEELPPVLILNLKTFLYDAVAGSTIKVIKKIQFDVDLNIPKDWLSENARGRIPNHLRQYKLCSVVFHQGVKGTGGHYVAVTFDLASQGWLLKDDNRVDMISESDLLNYIDNNIKNKMPYILIYRQRTNYTPNGTVSVSAKRADSS